MNCELSMSIYIDLKGCLGFFVYCIRFFEKMNYLRETGTFDWLNNWAVF